MDSDGPVYGCFEADNVTVLRVAGRGKGGRERVCHGLWGKDQLCDFKAGRRLRLMTGDASRDRWEVVQNFNEGKQPGPWYL